MGRALTSFALVCIAGLRAARADEQAPVDIDEQREENDSFWARAAHPGQVRYRALLKRAQAQAASSQFNEAVTTLREAVTLQPGDPYAHYLLASMQNQLWQWADCAASVLQVERLSPAYTPPEDAPGSKRFDFMAGVCLSLAGQVDDAVAHYRRVLLADTPGPDSPPAVVHWNLGDCYQALGRLDDAIGEYTQAVAAAPQEAMPHFALAVALDRDEQVARGREEMTRALRLDPGLVKMTDSQVIYLPPADVYYYLALAHMVASESEALAGRRALAIAYFRWYLDKIPTSPWALRTATHLAELGSPALSEAEVSVQPAKAAEAAAATRAVVAAGPELQKCLAGAHASVIRANRVLLPAGRSPGPDGGLQMSAMGPEAARTEARECVQRIVRGLKMPVPAKEIVRVTVTVIPR